jgi:RND superfamily putative drug exporter
VVFIILMLLLRALVAPLILTATVVLSFAAALGVSAFFFNHLFGFGGADTSFRPSVIRDLTWPVTRIGTGS